MANPENIVGKGFEKHPERINKKGRPRKLPELDVLLAEVFGDSEMKKIINAMYKLALKGNVKAAEIILDRAYGKAKQSFDLGLTEETITAIKLVRGNEGTDNKTQ